MPLDIGSFFNMQEWNVVVEFLKDKEKALVDELITAGRRGEGSLVSNLTGRIEELRELITLPEYFTAAHRGIREEKDNAQEPH